MLKGAAMRRLVILLLMMSAPAAPAGSLPHALAQVTGGLWEISGAPGSQMPVRQCIADVQTLAQFEHRTRNCSRDTVMDKEGTTVISYTCGPADFGQTQIDVVTPRSLRISTQGISAQLPFSYVLQARRVGECTNVPSTRH